MTDRLATPATDVELDVRALLRALLRALPVLILLLLIVAAGTYYGLSQIEPVYKSQATVLIETGESDLTRPANAPADSNGPLDEQAIASQVQLILSRDVARNVVARLKLASRPEFDPAVLGRTFIGELLAKVGLAQPVRDASPEELVLAEYFRNLSVYAINNSRVIAIDFSSTDPALAADVANAVAEEYIELQREARRGTADDATRFLEGQIADLRAKVKDAEAKVETYRSSQGLFNSGGSSPVTLTEQQLADLNAELSRVRAARAESEAKAAQIKAALKTNAVPNITDVLNSPLIQQLISQQVGLRAQIAQLTATLLPEHPRMRELYAQIDDLDAQIAREAGKILAAVESDTQLAQAREKEILAGLDQLKTGAATANDAGVELRALEREASAQRDLLDTYLRRYREAIAHQRGDFLPADARIVSRAAAAVYPDFPRKIPMTAAAAVAFLLLAIAFVLVRAIASGRAMREVRLAEPLPVVPDAVPVDGHRRWADDHGVRRMMPRDPTIAPAMASEVEHSLAAISSQIVKDDKRRILVTLAEGSDASGRPLAAVALARALARADRQVVLVDLRGDGADSTTMGEGTDLPGFSDLFAGEASFAQVIFRDRASRAHFIPAGGRPILAETIAGERLTTILGALDHTYDHLVIDAGDDLIGLLAPPSGAAMVVSEFGAADPRTVRACERIAAASSATILLLVVDPSPPVEAAVVEKAHVGEEAA